MHTVPVEMPQLRRHIFSSGALGLILTAQAASSTVYSAKVEVLRKWYNGCRTPELRSTTENLVPPSEVMVLLNGLTR
jgi:hypothetical protein